VERQDELRQRIIAAMAKKAAAKGFSGVTMEELAQASGLSKRTVYRCFRNKEEVIAAVLEAFLAKSAGNIDQAIAASGDPVEKMTKILAVIPENVQFLSLLALQDLQQHYPHLWWRLDEFRASRIQQLMVSLLSARENAERFRPVDPVVFSQLMLAGVRAVVDPIFIFDSGRSLEEVLQTIRTVFLYGVVKTSGTGGMPLDKPESEGGEAQDGSHRQRRQIMGRK